MIRDVKLVSLLVLAAAVLAGADHRVSASDVVQLVLSSVYSDHDDSRLANDLHRLKMSEQLDGHVLVYFRNIGVGPLARKELERLRQESALMKLPFEPPLSIQPIPPDDQRMRMVEKVERYAQSYVHGLPNFMCDEVTRRYSNMSWYPEDVKPSDRLHFTDSFSKNLRFADGVEEGIVPHRPGKREVKISTRKGQSISSGEFGTDMLIIFGPDIHAETHWDHWEMFRGRRTAVLQYFVGLPKSRYTLAACCSFVPGKGEMQQRVTASIRGVVYIDPDSGVISRIAIKPVALPEAFHLKENETLIDYDDVRIGNRLYRLPVKAVAFIRGEIESEPGYNKTVPIQKNRNEISFINYRKFEAESALTFANSKITYEDPVTK